MRYCIIFDIDGTLSNPEHRLHLIKTEPKQWDEFYAAARMDLPIKPIVALAGIIGEKCPIICVTGRVESIRGDTREWLDEYSIDYRGLYMRADGDTRDDFVVKAELFDQMKADGWDPIIAFEDRTQVVEMWRSKGVICAQVAEGNF